MKLFVKVVGSFKSLIIFSKILILDFSQCLRSVSVELLNLNLLLYGNARKKKCIFLYLLNGGIDTFVFILFVISFLPIHFQSNVFTKKTLLNFVWINVPISQDHFKHTLFWLNMFRTNTPFYEVKTWSISMVKINFVCAQADVEKCSEICGFGLKQLF